MARLEPRLRQVVKKLCTIFQKHKDNGQPLDLSNLYRCFTIDVITDYCFPDCYGFMATPDYSRDFFFTLRKFSQLSVWNRHIPILLHLHKVIPLRLLGLINRHIPSVIKFQKVCLIFEAKASINTDICMKSFTTQAKKVIDDKDFNPKSRDYAAVLYEIRDSDLPAEEKSLARMSHEALTLVSAGLETTGATLATITYHLLRNPDVLRRLKDELDSVSEDHTEIVGYQKLRELPYLVSGYGYELSVWYV